VPNVVDLSLTVLCSGVRKRGLVVLRPSYTLSPLSIERLRCVLVITNPDATYYRKLSGTSRLLPSRTLRFVLSVMWGRKLAKHATVVINAEKQWDPSSQEDAFFVAYTVMAGDFDFPAKRHLPTPNSFYA